MCVAWGQYRGTHSVLSDPDAGGNVYASFIEARTDVQVSTSPKE